MTTGSSNFKTSQIVTVEGGTIEGTHQDDITIFKGIPFAAPPTGDLRWKAPQPVQPWSETLKTTDFKPGCPQDPMMAMMPPGTVFSEDCLYLNVWTPATTPDDNIPVLVWIYGGGFNGGLTAIPMYNGMKLAQKGVVFISIAYRVGPYGFLAHPELSQESGQGSGTYGLQDMIAALKWIRKNIQVFGGDSSKVTIFGHSAGGIATSMLAASPKGKGLFEGVISMSGGSFAPSKFGDEAGQNVPTLGLAESMGKDFLNTLGVEDIASARKLSTDAIQQGVAKSGMPFMFWPAEDGNIIVSDQYLLYEEGRFHDTPILIGSTSDEAASFLIPPGAEGPPGPFSQAPSTMADYTRKIKDEYGPTADTILKAYACETDEDAFRAIKGVMRDNMFGWHTWSWAKFQSTKGRHNAFVYYFDQHGPETPDGAGHGADVPSAFKTLGDVPPGPGNPMVPPNETDFAVSDLMSSYFVNFVKTGDPNAPGLPEWPVFQETDQQAMIFDAGTSARPLPNVDQLTALDEYYTWRREEARNKRLQKT